MWFIYTYALGFNFLLPFVRNLEEVTVNKNLLYHVVVMTWTAVRYLFWVGIPILIIACVSIAQRVKAYLSKQSIYSHDFFFLFFLLMTTEWILIRAAVFGFPKYHAAMMPSLIIVVIYAVEKLGAQRILNTMKQESARYILYTAATLLFFVLVLKDTFLYEFIYLSISRGEQVKLIALSFFFMLLPIPVWYLIVSLQQRILRKMPALIVASLIALVALNIATMAYQVQTDYSHNYYYGETGFKETVAFVNEHIPLNATVIYPRGMSCYTDHAFVLAEGFMGYDYGKMVELADTHAIQYIVIRDKYVLFQPQLRQFIADHFSEIHTEGNFMVYRKG